jgi:hypothetical protein
MTLIGTMFVPVRPHTSVDELVSDLYLYSCCSKAHLPPERRRCWQAYQTSRWPQQAWKPSLTPR